MGDASPSKKVLDFTRTLRTKSAAAKIPSVDTDALHKSATENGVDANVRIYGKGFSGNATALPQPKSTTLRQNASANDDAPDVAENGNAELYLNEKGQLIKNKASYKSHLISQFNKISSDFNKSNYKYYHENKINKKYKL